MPGHLEHADFIGRAKAVLDGAENAVLMIAVTFKIHDGVDHVFQNARARDLAILGHMPDQNRDAACILGKHHQIERAFAKLCGTPWSARQVALIDRLNRINYEHLRLEFLRLLQDFFEASFAKQKHIGARYVQALAAELDLNRALFAAYIKRLDAGGCHGGECR